jgi:hypothetical protein
VRLKTRAHSRNFLDLGALKKRRIAQLKIKTEISRLKSSTIIATEDTFLPPSFLIGMKNRFLAHFYSRYYENEIEK